MRYKIKTTSLEDFERAREVAEKDTSVYVVSERRLMLSTGDLSDDAKAELDSLGASVSQDMQYQVDAA